MEQESHNGTSKSDVAILGLITDVHSWLCTKFTVQ